MMSVGAVSRVKGGMPVVVCPVDVSGMGFSHKTEALNRVLSQHEKSADEASCKMKVFAYAVMIVIMLMLLG
jgi:hypothetical protein